MGYLAATKGVLFRACDESGKTCVSLGRGSGRAGLAAGQIRREVLWAYYVCTETGPIHTRSIEPPSTWAGPKATARFMSFLCNENLF
jgi:hypothetical protein